ncbi:uncharacterized protein LOC129592381 [Paramacrobiotus metropolitanus]|uniref:uncharacterized protein LOC129592381 n=1 Tax=Paramacrobiotus metropolitanus TaxID=2943436 RepID=UPI002445B539|nr:uncharacterized protein LOC129592381 [Paramacrobiotus metropolitanus]
MIPLNSDFHKDLGWWREFLPTWNGTASFLQPDWTRSDVLHLYTDASATHGLGAYCQGAWFQLHWQLWITELQPCIEYLEMVPILLSVIVWGKKLAGLKVVFHCDNAGATHAWENLRSTNRGVLDIMRRLVKAAAVANMTLTLKHIAGINNEIADALSRFQQSRFRRLAPQAELHPVDCPDIFPDLRAALCHPQS